MKNKGWPVVILVILVCLSIPVVKKELEQAQVRALEDFGREQFLENDLADYVRRKAMASGISDLRAEASVFSWYESYPNFYDRKNRTLQMECRISFCSDDIDKYYTQTWDSLNARTVHTMLTKLRNSCKSESHTYTCPKGTVHVAVRGMNNDWQTIVTSGKGHVYELQVSDSYSTLDIDDEMLYYRDGKPSTYTPPESSAGTGKTGAGTGKTGTGSSNTGKRKNTTRKSGNSSSWEDSIDPDDYDIDAYYDDNRDVYDDWDEAWEGFMDDEEAWDDY